jgi:hypothetical protein
MRIYEQRKEVCGFSNVTFGTRDLISVCLFFVFCLIWEEAEKKKALLPQ